MKGVKVIAAAVALAIVVTLPVSGASVFGTGGTAVPVVKAVSLDAGAAFSDVPAEHWAASFIDDMVKARILQGYPDGSFRPAGIVTYGEFLKMAVSAAGLTPETTEKGHWAQPYYEAGFSAGWYGEYDVSAGDLDQAIPRNKMALIVASALKDSGAAAWGGSLTGISDVASGNPYAYEISLAYNAGLLTGYPDGTFRPMGTLTRAEAAAAIWRLMEKLPETEETEDAEAQAPDKGFSESEGTYSRTDYPEGDRYIFNDPSDPEGTLHIVYNNKSGDTGAQLERIQTALNKELGSDGSGAWTAFLDWKGKTLDEGISGMVKQYLGDRPTLMDASGSQLHIFLYPKTYQDPYWDTAPGEVNEFFF